MTATLDAVPKKSKEPPSAELVAARELVRQAREQGLSLTGPDGLLKQLTKTVLETRWTRSSPSTSATTSTHRRRSGNVRNGTRPKTVLTEATGHVEIDVPGIGRGRSSRRSCASDNGACRASTRSCCRSTRKG